MNFLKLNEMELDALKEVFNVGAGNAATALSQMLNKKIDMDVPSFKFIDIEELNKKINLENICVGVLVNVYGDLPGSFLILFEEDVAFDIIKQLTGTTDNNFNEISESVLAEIVNIILGAYMNAISKFTNLNMVPSVPAVAFDFAGAIITTTFIASIEESDKMLEIKTILKNDNNCNLVGDFYYLPSQNSLQKIFKSIGLI
ncbi:chemotaxis protein CheC [Clostridium mediterraneense]|uniref:chemotaxis protein CheC n=1 Tax=Clostridium mediterraneense TaxID=1805472 RepID=UPI00082D59AE|nr:chemotaxis protein CheC [Clostridium mediterraneense]